MVSLLKDHSVVAHRVYLPLLATTYVICITSYEESWMHCVVNKLYIVIGFIGELLLRVVASKVFKPIYRIWTAIKLLLAIYTFFL